ncbi:MAG: NUDIX domain-containing protein [Cyanobacteriota bacterium]|nr:NUDIX domain-containing protein [Cyanobacteriota bacterium]
MPRIRGTALVVRDGHFLLVRDKGAPSFSLPGGGQNPGEPALATAARELEAFIWWNGKDDVPRYPHVDEILRRCGLLA